MNEKEDIKDKKKQVIGLYGEMQLAMILHERGWQVHRSYIDEGIDFVITKYWCRNCRSFTIQLIRNQKYEGKDKKCVTNLCNNCCQDSIIIVSKYLQIKTSEGIKHNKNDIRKFSFHPKIRYNLGKDIFYVWIAVFLEEKDIQAAQINSTITHYYIFNTKDVELFDNLKIDAYQITDNQKTTLTINKKGIVMNKGKKYNYDCFKDFYNNFKKLDTFISNEQEK